VGFLARERSKCILGKRQAYSQDNLYRLKTNHPWFLGLTT
jgi:hypothetical protein